MILEGLEHSAYHTRNFNVFLRLWSTGAFQRTSLKNGKQIRTRNIKTSHSSKPSLSENDSFPELADLGKSQHRMDQSLVQKVSRSFALSLQWLPQAQRNAVCAAYLAARYADTITDCGNWSTEERAKALDSWEEALLQKSKKPWALKLSLGSFSSREAELLSHGTDILATLHALDAFQLRPTQEVLQTLISAMRWDLRVFRDASSTTVVSGCKDMASFEWYTFSIAGCVGRFWVKIFELNHHLDQLAVEYGKGLQRINVLRDTCEDHRRGRLYHPIADLERFKVQGSPPWESAGWNDYVSAFIMETRKRLRYGANFCDAIPYHRWRLRFASMMPVLIGLKTLDLIEKRKDFGGGATMKISRRQIKLLIFQAAFSVVTKSSLSRRIKI